jgi:hypothetical protein
MLVKYFVINTSKFECLLRFVITEAYIFAHTVAVGCMGDVYFAW